MAASSGRPVLALSMGEPAGIGPELAGRVWELRKDCDIPPFVFIGAPAALRAHGFRGPVSCLGEPGMAAAAFADSLPLIEVPLAAAVRPGTPSPANAQAVIRAIDLAAGLVREGKAGALVTLPIHKATLYGTGFTASGHTDYLAALTGRPSGDAVMMLAVPGLRVVPLTVHVALARVPALVTIERVRHVATILDTALKRDFGITRPRIALAGLNPHAGESGGMGSEEDTVLRPAIEALRASGIGIAGPFSADSMFHEAARGGYDAALCMYHDQALIPLKTIDFDHGVNITLGLDFVRTSPDHGTAFDIAGKGVARPESLIAALRTAEELVTRRARQA